MSEIFKQIRADQLQARKNKDVIATALLTTLIGEIERMSANDAKKGATVDDARVIDKTKTMVNSVELSLQHADDKSRFLTELDILKSYLPSMMSDDELRSEISRLKNEGKQVGEIMAYLNANYTGRFDRKTASEIARA